jgi:uncharacterized protein (TIGR02246 family)
MPDGAEQAIEQLFRRHVEALNAGDRETAVAEWADDSEFVDAAARVAEGRDGVRAHFEDFVRARIELRPKATIYRDQGRGFATLRWHYDLFVPRRSEPEPRLWRSGIVTWVLDNGSGEWRVRFGQNTFEPVES